MGLGECARGVALREGAKGVGFGGVLRNGC